MVGKRIVWDESAKEEFKNYIQRIKSESIQNAEKVKNAIISKIGKITVQETQYPLDKNKTDNDGNYRAFEIYHIRIAYFIGESEIRIIRFRSTHQEPLLY